MAAYLNSAILNSTNLDSAILVFLLKLAHTCKIVSHHLHKKTFTHSFSLNLMMAAILNSTILDSAILVFPLKLTVAKIGSHHLHKKTFTHLFWLNLMMAAILNSIMLDSDTAILDSDTFLSSLRFTQKHSPSTLTLDSN